MAKKKKHGSESRVHKQIDSTQDESSRDNCNSNATGCHRFSAGNTWKEYLEVEKRTS